MALKFLQVSEKIKIVNLGKILPFFLQLSFKLFA